MNKVEVYFNLHKKLFSVRDCKTGRVIDHTNHIAIANPQFVVRKAGRERVLRERKKNVHAFVRGYILPEDDEACARNYFHTVFHGKEVTYNPYKWDSFVVKDISDSGYVTAKPIDKATLAVLSGGGDQKVTTKVRLGAGYEYI